MAWDNLFEKVEHPHKRQHFLLAVGVRFVALVMILLTLVLPKQPSWTIAHHWLFYAIFALVAVGYIAIFFMLKKWQAPGKTSIAFSALDIVSLTLLIAFTGGLHSPFIIIYLFHLAGTTIFGSILQAIVVSLGGFAMMALVALLSRIGPLATFAVFTETSKDADSYAMQLGLFLIILAFFVTYALVANIYLNRRVNEYRKLLDEREARLKAATSELTRSFYDLESMNDRIRAHGEVEQKDRRQLLATERAGRTGQLAAGAIHDLANPISAIMVEAEMFFVKGEEKPEKFREIMQRIVIYAQRLGQIADNLRILTRPQSETIFSGVEINRVVRRCMSVLESERKHRGAVFNAYLDESNPKVLGVESLLEQAMINLVINSLQGLEKPGGHITVRTRVDENKVQVEVEDDGIGIPPEIIAHVFDPFFTTRSDQGMLGLGLFTVRSVVEEHNGTVGARSETGIATVFTLTLPMMK